MDDTFVTDKCDGGRWLFVIRGVLWQLIQRKQSFDRSSEVNLTVLTSADSRGWALEQL
jgi:hypothetical protein